MQEVSRKHAVAHSSTRAPPWYRHWIEAREQQGRTATLALSLAAVWAWRRHWSRIGVPASQPRMAQAEATLLPGPGGPCCFASLRQDRLRAEMGWQEYTGDAGAGPGHFPHAQPASAEREIDICISQQAERGSPQILALLPD